MMSYKKPLPLSRINSVIRQYTVDDADQSTLLLPKYAKILKIDCTKGKMFNILLWAMVDPADPEEERTFQVWPNDTPMVWDDVPELHTRIYVGTAYHKEEGYVAHVFEIVPLYSPATIQLLSNEK